MITGFEYNGLWDDLPECKCIKMIFSQIIQCLKTAFLRPCKCLAI